MKYYVLEMTSQFYNLSIWLSKNFCMKDLREATCILWIKIYRDKSRRLLGLSQSTYIDRMPKRFSIDQSKRGFIPMIHGITLSKSMCLKTQEERTCMCLIPYASAIGSIMYTMICNRTRVSYSLSVMGIYESDLDEGH